MKPLASLGVLAAACLLLPGCAQHAAHDPYVAFKESTEYRKTSEIYRDETLLEQAHRSNTRIRVNLTEQRAQLLVNDKVALDTPCCTGKAGKRTPPGTFPIKEKIRDKRSTIFGSLYKGGIKVHRGDRRKYQGSYDRYVGSSLPYWMRLTSGGIGMHGSNHVHRYPGSNGCIRVPHSAVSTIYSKVGPGTNVEVTR